MASDDERALIEAICEANRSHYEKPRNLSGGSDAWGKAILAALAQHPDRLLSFLVAQRVPCDGCKGTGHEHGVVYNDRCSTCHGEGTVPFDVVAALVKLGVPIEKRAYEGVAPLDFRRSSLHSQEAPNG